MKTLEQILEGVTAGGQWDVEGVDIYAAGTRGMLAEFWSPGTNREALFNAAYAAWAARHAPALFRALDLMIYAPDSAEAMRVARNAMAEALKD